MLCKLLSGTLGVAAFIISVGFAHAHATLEKTEAAPNSSYRGVVRITHGCGGSPTLAVRVQIPEGVIGARPMPKPGWRLATTKGPYARTYGFYHEPLSAGVKEITWSDGKVGDDEYDEFVFSAYISDAFAPGTTVYFPIVQKCAEGANNWVEVPSGGQAAHALKQPAPGVRIVAAAAAEVPPPVVTAGALRIEAPWLRATPGGAKVGGGYVRITNTGSEPDRLTAAGIPLAGRGEVHEMSTQDGVMHMRQLGEGLVIAPGQTVELRPGGYHLMFMNLTAPLKEGETLQGTLTFEKAGVVPVTFRVRGIGGAPPASGHEGH